MTQENQLYQGCMLTPIGKLKVVANQKGITEVVFIDDADPVVEDHNALVELGLTQLKEYFAGDRRQFDLPMDAKGTDFRKQVWSSLVDSDK